MRKSIEDRFWDKVNVGTELAFARGKILSPCWNWLAAKSNKGYGHFWNGKKVISAYVFSYKMIIGNYDQNLELDHVCENPSCVNPEHLEPVTRQVNTQRSSKNKDSYTLNFKKSPRAGKPLGRGLKHKKRKYDLPVCVKPASESKSFVVQVGYKYKRYSMCGIKSVEEAVIKRDEFLKDPEAWILKNKIKH